VQEYEPELTVRKIRAGISKSSSRIKSDFFSATFILGLTDKEPKYAINIPDMPLEIEPRLDLYRERLLFQGPRFQKIDKVWSISATGENGKDAIFSSKLQDLSQAAEDAFTDPLHRTLFLGDPFLRDSLLQSAQMLVPKKICRDQDPRCQDSGSEIKDRYKRKYGIGSLFFSQRYYRLPY